MKKKYEILTKEDNDVLQEGDESYSSYSGWMEVSRCSYGFECESQGIYRREVKNTPKKFIEPLYAVKLTGSQITVLEEIVDAFGINVVNSNQAGTICDILMRLADKKEI